MYKIILAAVAGAAVAAPLTVAAVVQEPGHVLGVVSAAEAGRLVDICESPNRGGFTVDFCQALMDEIEAFDADN